MATTTNQGKPTMELTVVTSGCGCICCPQLKLSVPCSRESHVAGWPEYMWVSREELIQAVMEGIDEHVNR